MRKGQRIAANLLAAAAMSVGSIAIADVAMAQPVGCSANSTTLSVGATGLLTGATSSNCAGSATRTIVAEIKWDRNLSTDPKVSGNSSNLTGTRYFVSTQSCDGGNTRGYYARGYFTTSTTYYDTTPRNIRTC